MILKTTYVVFKISKIIICINYNATFNRLCYSYGANFFLFNKKYFKLSRQWNNSFQLCRFRFRICRKLRLYSFRYWFFIIYTVIIFIVTRMGQPGNIVVNKLGSNIFWKYDYIFSKNQTNYYTNYKLFINLIEHLVKLGFSFQRNCLYNFKWLNLQYYAPFVDYSKNFRRYYVRDKYTRIKVSFLGLKKKGIYFFSNLYVFKLNNWIILYQMVFNNYLNNSSKKSSYFYDFVKKQYNMYNFKYCLNFLKSVLVLKCFFIYAINLNYKNNFYLF